MLQILDMNTNPSNVFVFAVSIFEILSLFLIEPYFENQSLPDFLLNINLVGILWESWKLFLQQFNL